MALTSIISHQLLRNSPDNKVDVKLRVETFNINGRLEELFYELKSQFLRKSGKTYGRFSTDTAEFPFSAWLREYRQERLGFASFTQRAIKELQSLLEKNASLFDMHLFFAEEKFETGHYLYLFAIEHMSGLYLNADIQLEDSRYLDTNGFYLAAKIDLLEWENDASLTYLTLMRARGDKDLSEALAKLTGFSDKHDIKSDTSEFLEIVDRYSESLDEQTARATRATVVDYCLEKNKAGKSVVIAELSDTLSKELKTSEPHKFYQFVETRQSEKKSEFIPDASQLRNYVRISGRNDSLSMSFASECLGNEIIYDAEQDVLTIKNIPAALKSRLLKHLKGS